MSHIPVLQKETIAVLSLQKNDTVIDGTVNEGGHASLIVPHLEKAGTFIGIDLDKNALKIAEEKINTLSPCKKVFFHGNFKDFPNVLEQEGLATFDKIILDLGWSMNQFDDPERGFSFMKDGPLSMALDTDSQITAYDIVNGLGQEELANIIFKYGEEGFSRSIAKSICEIRRHSPIKTTFELVEAIKSGVPVFYTRQRTHCATKTFQALRIMVNRELESLEEFLEICLPYVTPKTGIIGIISFHSLEDRIVKHTFRKWKEEGLVADLLKGGVIATEEELSENKRARSARLRAIRKN